MNPPEDYVNRPNGNFSIRTNEHNCGSDEWAATQSRGEEYSSGLPPTNGRRIDEAAIPFDETHTEGRSANASNHMKNRRGNNFPSHDYRADRFRRSRYRPTRGGRANGKFFFANKTLYVGGPPSRETPHQGDEATMQRDASSFVNQSQQGNLRKGQKRKWSQAPPEGVPTEEEASTSDSDCVKGEKQEEEEEDEDENEGNEANAEDPLSQFTQSKNPRSKSYNEITANILKDAAEYFKNCRGARTETSSEDDDDDANELANDRQVTPGESPQSVNLCCVCQINQHKYKCPFCEALTCSLTCAKEHKKIKKCKNKLKKNLKVQKVAKKDLDENMLHRDYIFLHGIESILHGNYRYMRIKENETTNIWLYSYSKLINVLKKKKIFLLKAPLYTKLHQGNKTTIRHDSIFWMVKVTLVNDCLFVTHQDVSEDTSLLQLLTLSLAKVEKSRKPLQVNYLDNLNAIRVSLDCVEVNKGTKKTDASFCVLHTVSEVLRGQTFYEYPHLSFEIIFQDGLPVENPAYEEAKRRQQGSNDVDEEGHTNEQRNDAVHEDNPSQADDAPTAPICDEQTEGQTHVEEQTNPPPQGEPS
ncbi:Uncharacterized protein PCOAH_00001870 [Plasmodium coatneyi]|uniref:HIT-type domain-containing protein n=1 Tax=Plasmodium coatneyi TaxID=208452 RepID=A0A1B1DSR9_9APIC|nr:Uncharacterized protein PCOAH_00001870 [Plasmodium coatneyi]ANQ05784.1 Uncharacterized protein PCOAH_00001870 [Plasmodium coatneyi]